MSLPNSQNGNCGIARTAVKSSKDFVGEHAISTTLTAFGLGVGAGIALVFLMSDLPRQQHEAGVAYRGRQILDALASAVPDSLTHFGR